MSVINEMLRDLNRRGEAQARINPSMERRVPAAPRRAGRWKLAGWSLAVPLLFAAGWFLLQPVLGPIPVFGPIIGGSTPSAPPADTIASPGDPQASESKPAPLLAQPASPANSGASALQLRSIFSLDQNPRSAPRKLEAPALQGQSATVGNPAQLPPSKPEAPAGKEEIRTPERAEVLNAILNRPAVIAPPVNTEKEQEKEQEKEKAAPAREAAKGSISLDRQDRGPNRAATEYRNAVALMNQGRIELALDAFANALRADPRHAAARQALVALLLERGRAADAQSVLREGISVAPENTDQAMMLARLQVESGNAAGALATLDGAMPYAKNRPDYHAFAGTLLQMQGRHAEAIAHYDIATRLAPQSGRWLMGLAMSLEEDNRMAEAREAYRRALATNVLDPDLLAFVERKLQQLK